MRHVGRREASPEELAAHTVRRRQARQYVWSRLGIAVALPLVAWGSLLMARTGAWAFVPCALFGVPAAILAAPFCLVVAFQRLMDQVRALPVARQGLEVDVFLDDAMGISKVFVVHPDHARVMDSQMRVAVTAPMRPPGAGGALSDIERAELRFIVARVERRMRRRLGLVGTLPVATVIITWVVTRSAVHGAMLGAVAVVGLVLVSHYLVRSDAALRARLAADVADAVLVHVEGTDDLVLHHSSLLWQRASRPGSDRCCDGGLADPRFASEPFGVPDRGRMGF